MSDSPGGRLRVVLCWHMHQPDYWNTESGQYVLPWTYLHAIKDYVDMAAIIERTPGARAVVNFAPTLLEQLEHYSVQIKDFFDAGAPLRDPLLAALISPALPPDGELRLNIIKACRRANEHRLIDRFPPFRELVDLASCIGEQPVKAAYLDEQYLVDLLVWYHLAWMAETVRREDERVRILMNKARGFTQKDRRMLLGIIGELVSSVIGRYRVLAEQGRIELSTTPYAHPIMPLLLDINSTHEAMPNAPLPAAGLYPGGEARSRWHIEKGLEVFESHFGFRPAGCWPAEGGVSVPTLKLLGESGFRWAATGGSVLGNTLDATGVTTDCIHRPYRVAGSGIYCFFRDDGLSDAIGFTYSNWHGDDAVNNFVHHLENIAEACAGEPERVVGIILDGENAWEHYPENGYHFLCGLYRKLADHPAIELTTFGEVAEAAPAACELPGLVAGSWVYGTFSTWIGESDKNRGWDLLIEAKKAFDLAVADGTLQGERLERAEKQLALCEGSDWFWWFGDYNPSDSVRDFDRMYRLHLAELYRLIGAEAPDSLRKIISYGGGAPQMGGVMRRGQEVT